MSDLVKRGYFFIADISGYTKFLAETEIKHAKGILESLFDAMLPTLTKPMALSGMRGDAFFAYAIDSEVVSKQYILDMAEKVYARFVQERDKININNSCPCNACKTVDELELKVIIHHGEFIEQESKGTVELAGNDVNAVFRLLKNNVEETTGLNAYALISCDALKVMDLGDYFPETAYHSEEYDHIGEVKFVVHDLKEAYGRKRKVNSIRVNEQDALIAPETSTMTPLSMDAAFFMCSRPEMRMKWVAADAVEHFNKKGNVIEAGSVYHCHHGDEIFVFEIVDWRPGEYVTGEYRLPMGMKIRETNDFISVGTGTTVRIRYSDIIAETFMAKVMRVLARGKVKKLFEAAAIRCSENIVTLSNEMADKDATLKA